MKECWEKNKGKRKRDEKSKGRDKGKKKQKKDEEMNEGAETVEVMFNIEEQLKFDNPSDEGQHFNIDTYSACNMNGINERVAYYNWLADSATTSHITNRRDAFTTYQLILDTSVVGVGNAKVIAEGRGTIELESNYNGHKYIICLKEVLYIPSNHNNLISLGRWDNVGGRYTGGGGVLILITKDGKRVVKGTKVENNLYKMNLKVHYPQANPLKKVAVTPQTYMATEPGQSWETWHKRFRHTSYSRLQKLLDLDLVEGFSVDTRTPKPDCVTCTEAKQTEEPFKKSMNQKTEPGKLTHIDLWGKYDVQSINGNQYYLLFMDDSARYATAEYLKQKSDAVQKVIEYLVHLKTQERAPKAIRIDCSKEFVNETLQSWCHQQGIEIQMTAPYSPSQNGVAERMNRTLVKLARATIKGQKLPEFLWELAVAHAIYLRNHSYTSPLKWKTPYKIWFKRKPSISHLREFGAPVWVLLQGQHKERKMKPKSKQQAYVGYDDGSKSVQYYNAETCKILTFQNYHFLTLPEKESPPEEIEVAPNTPHEEERKASMQPMGTKGNLKRKQPAKEEPLDLDSPRKNCGRHVNYRYLHDPFPDE
jgi:hypothetical protein